VNYDLSDYVQEEIARRRVPLAVVKSHFGKSAPESTRTRRCDVLSIEDRDQ